MAKLLRHYKPRHSFGRPTQRPLEGLERVTTTPLDGSSYEFMLENLMEPPTDQFDRWRNRMPQG